MDSVWDITSMCAIIASKLPMFSLGGTDRYGTGPSE